MVFISVAAEEEAKKVAHKQKKELNRFWKDIYLILQGAPQTSKLQDVACLDYIVKEDIFSKSLEDNEAKVNNITHTCCCLLFVYKLHNSVHRV